MRIRVGHKKSIKENFQPQTHTDTHGPKHFFSPDYLFRTAQGCHRDSAIIGAHPEMVDFGSIQGRSDFATVPLKAE
jgi:hypothetical protein